MNLEQLRIRGVSRQPTGKLTNPLRRLLWPLNRPYYAALLEDRPAAADTREVRAAGGNDLRYDALKKDLTAIAHRLASLEARGEPGAIVEPQEPAEPGGAPSDLPEQARPSFAQCGEDRIAEYLLRIAGAPEAIRYLDIGAALPTGDNNTYLFYQRGGSGVLVEADPAYMPAYRALRPRDAIESVAVVTAAMLPADAMVELSIAENAGWTSVLPGHVDEAARRGKGGLRRRIRVPAATIRDIMERHFAVGELHLVSIDIEGVSDVVLAEMDLGRYRPWIIIAETMGETGPAELLARHGYTDYATTYVNRIFVRSDILERADF